MVFEIVEVFGTTSNQGLFRNSKLVRMGSKPRFETLPPEVKFEQTHHPFL